MPVLLTRRSWEAAELAARFPPRFTNPNKRVVHAIACPPGSTPSGTVTMSRWAPSELPRPLPAREPVVLDVPGYFPYDVPGADRIDWTLNFADPELFAFYGGALFAQDEMQVTEHPALASVRQAMLAEGIPTRTVENRQATPVLVAGVERVCEVDTAPCLERVSGLYGNRFAAAPEAAVRSATRRIDPPTRSNILAIAALSGGDGAYDHEDILTTLVTATTGFAAAVEESARLAPGAKVGIHTGFWGCGAFGGNRVLMTVVQVLAARLAGVDTITFHTGDATGARSIAEARRVIGEVLMDGAPVATVVDRLVERRFPWGVSDGN